MNPNPKSPTAKKEARLNIRTTQEQKRAIEEAARARQMSASQFVMQSSLQAAEQILAEQSRFTVSQQQWDEFVSLLDRPARVIPEVRRAAAKKSPFSER